MKFSYLIIAHNEPEVFGTLLGLLDDGRNDIFVHVDARADITQFRRFKTERSSLYFIERMPVYWGDESQIEVELRLLRTAHSTGHYDYYHLLSGVDLPLKSQNYIHRFFEEHAGTEFVGVTHSCFNVSDLDEKTRYYHLFTRYSRISSNNRGEFLQRLLRKTGHGLVRLQKALGVRRRYGVALAKGPNWFSITDSLCGHLLGREKAIMERFRYTFCPDEIFLQTEVVNSCFKERMFNPGDQFRSCMREIDWERGNPYVWRDGDTEELKRSDRLFARKFSARYMGVVNDIKDWVMSQE